jgi:hypothetical protein
LLVPQVVKREVIGLGKNHPDSMVIKENRDATDVLTSLRKFGSKVMGNGSAVMGIFFRRRANRFPAVQ